MPILETTKNLTIPPAGALVSLSVFEPVSTYNILPNGEAVTLSSNYEVSPSGTPVENLKYVFNYYGNVSVSGYEVKIFGFTMTAQEALGKYLVICTYTNGAWDVRLLFGMDHVGYPTINGAYIQAGTVDATAALADGSVTPAKLLTSTRGYFMRAGVSGIWEYVNGITVGNILLGTGEDVDSVPLSGDATISGSGVLTIANNAVTTAKINNAAVTTAKVSSDLKAEVLTVQVSFEATEQGAFKIKMLYPGSIVDCQAEAVKPIAATDSGTVVLKNAAGVTMTATTPIVFAASDPFGTTYDTAITANNTFVAGDVITVTTAKVTAGGKALVTLGIIRS